MSNVTITETVREIPPSEYPKEEGFYWVKERHYQCYEWNSDTDSGKSRYYSGDWVVRELREGDFVNCEGMSYFLAVIGPKINPPAP